MSENIKAPLPEEERRVLTMSEAQDFLNIKKSTAMNTASATAICLLSPLPIIWLSGMAQKGLMTGGAAFALGLILMIIIIIPALLLIRRSGKLLESFEFIETEALRPGEGVEEYIRAERDKFKNTYNLSNLAGVFLCIISMLPLGIVLIVSGAEVMNVVYAAAGMLIIIALALFLMVRAGSRWSGFSRALQEGGIKKGRTKEEKFRLIYWISVTLIFAVFIFLTGKWNLSWIIWLAGAVGYPLILEAIEKKNKK